VLARQGSDSNSGEQQDGGITPRRITFDTPERESFRPQLRF
jgi:hypothetical protein